MRAGARGLAVATLAVVSVTIVLVALTGGVAADGPAAAGATATAAGDGVNVTGRIVDADSGQGIDSGRVVLVNRSAGVEFDAVPNATGAFEVAVDPDLTYQVRYSQREDGFPLDGVVDKHPLGTVTVGSSDVDLGTEALPEAHRLNVTVVDDTGAPVENAEVAVEGTPGDPGPDVGNRTDAQGRFVLGGTVGTETNGSVTVYAFPPADALLEGNRTRVSVTGDRAVRVVLARQVQVTGRIETADGSAPTNYSASLWGDGRDGDTQRVAADGEFDLAVAPNRTYRFGFEQTDWDGPEVDFPRDGVPDVHAFRTVSVGSEATSLGTNRLPRAHVLDVTVVDGNGDPVEGASVDVGHRHGEATAWIHGRTTTDGRLSLEGAPEPGVEANGTVELHVEPPEGAMLDGNRTTLTVTRDRDLRIQLEPQVEVRGRIENADGSPVATGRVVLSNRSRETGGGDRLGSDGEFIAGVAPDLTYEARFDQRRADFPLDGVVDKHPLGTVEVGDENLDIGTRTLPEAHRLNVTVVNETGTPVEGAEVAVEGTSDSPGPDVENRTDAQGRFVLGGTPGTETNGSVTVYVFPPADALLEGNRTTVTVTDDRDLRVVLERAVRVTGRIEGADGSPVTDGGVALRNRSTGTFRVDGLNGTDEFAVEVPSNRTYDVLFGQVGPRERTPIDGIVDVYPLGTVAVGDEDVDLGSRTLPEAHRLNVTVVDDAGDPIEDARVSVETTVDGATASVSDETDARGRFVLGGTPGVETNGTVDVVVQPPGGIRSPVGSNATTVTVTRDRDLRVVLPRMVTISGRVVDPAGEPRANQTVVGFDVETGEFDAFSRTNATGAFAATVPANDTYAVTFGDGGTEPDERFPRNGIPDIYELAEVRPSGNVDVGEVAVPGGHVLDVRVVDGNGDPVTDAVVGVRSTRGEDTHGPAPRLRTGADGIARIDDRPYTGVEVAGPVAVEVNTTTADGSFTEPTVTRYLTVTSNRTVTVTVERARDDTLVVDPDDPAAYDTIGAAVEDAPAGATVRVAAAVYEERVEIDRPLTLTGAPGDAAPGPASDAPVLDGGGERQAGIVLADGAANVTVEGVEIRNYTRGGIETAGRVRNVTVRHNAIQDINGSNFSAGVNTFQLDTVHRSVVVERNRFEAIGGHAVLLLNVHGALVRDNAIVGTPDVRTNFFGEGSAGGIVVAPWANRTDVTTRNVRIETNTITGTMGSAGIGVIPRNVTADTHARAEAIRIRNNTVTGPNISRGVRITPVSANTSISGVSLDGNAFRSVERGLVVDARPLEQEDERGRIRRINVTRSVFANSTADAIRMVAGNASALRVHNSSIVDSGGAGLNNSATGTIDATYNWWGAPDGPSGAFDGSGDAVRGNATVRPFYVDAARTRLSSARLPPVTGDRRPLDPDGDGVYEDVNGDGDVTPGDATVLFRAVFNGNAAVTDNVAAFDFNDDGSVTPGDATVLFNEAF